MDPQRFDRLTRLTAVHSRRQIVKTLVGTVGGGLLALVGVPKSAARACRRGEEDCAGCCKAGECFLGTTDAACGVDGATCKRCKNTERCEGGECVSTCGPETCPNGCCDADGRCRNRTSNRRCGTNGAACIDCRADPCQAGSCQAGTCVPGAPRDCGQCATCNPLTGDCDPLPTGTECDDGDICTAGDFCRNGRCAAGEPLFCGQCQRCEPNRGCIRDRRQNGDPCDDGDPCTTGDVCANGECAGTSIVCPNAPCQSCNPATGVCEAGANGVDCDDGDTCTDGDVCDEGICRGAPRDCDDANPCTRDSCDPGTGCVNEPLPNGTACEFEDPCAGTVQSTCRDGVCSGVSEDRCPECQICNPATKQCEPRPNGSRCISFECTENDVCVDGTCVSGGSRLCPPCEDCNYVGIVVTCVPTKDDDRSCDDGDPCTNGDVCRGSQCAGTPIDGCRRCQGDADCDDGDPCTEDRCVDTVCVYTTLDGCCRSDADCDDGNPCTQNSCDTATNACRYPPLPSGSPCAGAPCTQPGTCDGNGACVSGEPIVCVALDQCHVAGVCDPATGQCSNPSASDGTACDDGDPCTFMDTCRDGVCEPGLDPCTECNACQPGMGCQPEPDGTPCGDGAMQCARGSCVAVTCAGAADGTPCDDGDLCTVGDTCQNGVCLGDALPCLLVCQACNPATGVCEQAPDGTECDDGDLCTIFDECRNGACVGEPRTCPSCTSCDPASGTCAPVADGTACDDGDLCTVGDFCLDGRCAAGEERFQCGDCQTCDPVLGCVDDPGQNGQLCDDGDPCTSPDTCQNGACVGDAVVCTSSDPCQVGTCDPTSGTCEFGPFCASGCCAAESGSATCLPGDAHTACGTGGTACQDCLALGGTCLAGAGTCQAPTCTDGLQNGNETDVDCGGSCPPCTTGATCAVNADCASQVCLASVCRPAYCIDGVKSGDESDVDCGGSCLACDDGARCLTNDDCLSHICLSGICGFCINQTCPPPPTCFDGVLNGTETDLDCGGLCDPCGVGQVCAIDADCTSGICSSGICQAKADGQACTLGTECGSGFCVDGVCCDLACTGACLACTSLKTGTGSDGVCGFVTAGTDPDDECTGTDVCDGQGTCTPLLPDLVPSSLTVILNSFGIVLTVGIENQGPGALSSATGMVNRFDLTPIAGGPDLPLGTFAMTIPGLPVDAVYFLRITEPWDQVTATWVNFGSNSGQYATRVAIDVTNLVPEWIGGEANNQGILLEDSPAGPLHFFFTREVSGPGSCTLEVCYASTCQDVPLPDDTDCDGGGTCQGGQCVPAPTCDDGIANGAETDVDCGGPDCPPCSAGQGCAVDADCASDVCTDNICQDTCPDFTILTQDGCCDTITATETACYDSNESPAEGPCCREPDEHCCTFVTSQTPFIGLGFCCPGSISDARCCGAGCCPDGTACVFASDEFCCCTNPEAQDCQVAGCTALSPGRS